MPNDEYTIQLHPKCNPVSVFCYNTQGVDPKASAVEYITLPAGPENNYAKYHKSRLVNFKTCSGPEDLNPIDTKSYWGQTW